jgi:hypothetical protein
MTVWFLLDEKVRNGSDFIKRIRKFNNIKMLLSLLLVGE